VAPVPQGTTYLELSEDNGSAHKFYEVSIAGTQVSIRYGRIGTAGALQTSTFPTPDKAESAAAKKIGEKVRKGYAPAVQGQRAARSITRREVVSAPSTARSGAPVLWRFRTGSNAFGIHIDEDRCWVGNQNGDVYTLSHGGEVQAHYRLPEGVKCLVADDFWIYAGCDDGTVYDLSSKVPFAAYKIAEDVDIFWLDIRDGVLGVSDAQGGLTVIDHEDEFQWSRKSPGTSAWMVRCDDRGVYHGHGTGVTAYSNDGREMWYTKTSSVLFGWQERDSVYAGTAHRAVHKLAKETGAIEASYKCDSAVYSCATAADGRYVFAGDSASSVYCFTASGERLWKLGTGCGSALSMQYRDQRLYIVTTDGSLACIDATDQAIAAAQSGTVPTAVDVKLAAAMPARVPTVNLATTNAASGGIVVECIDDHGRLRMRVVSPGYQSGWNVQFPQDIRQVGTRYVVEQVHESGRGFYRVRGEIKRLL
jgi:predicted DNA-binding WGR domain protein